MLYGKTQYPFYSVPASIKDITFKLIIFLYNCHIIDLIHKWRLNNYSFVFMLIILTSLTAKIFLNFVRANEACEND